MKLSMLGLTSLSLVLSALTGCSGGDGEIAVDGATSPLTAEGNDKLFTIRVLDARDGGYALDSLTVKVLVEDKEPVTVTCTTGDKNGSGTLDKDDTLDCTEPAANQFGADLAGKDIDVELDAKIDGEDTKVGTATWTPAK